MKIIYARQPLRKSIFLAGPTPRKDTKIPTWRPEAVRLLEIHLFDGDVFVPEDAEWENSKFDWDSQVDWEWEALNQATCILFWVPRDIEDMPAFTTNIEFGLTVHSSKVVLGYPKDAPKMSYMHALAKRYDIPVFHNLDQTVYAAMGKARFPFHNSR